MKNISKLVINRIATYIFCEVAQNTISGNYSVSIEDVKYLLPEGEKITLDVYEDICEALYNYFPDAILDLNEGDNEYYFNEGEFNVTIGGYFAINGDDDYDEDEEED